MIMEQEEKIFFKPGDIVKLKQNLPNSPTMMVYRVERSLVKNNNGNDFLRGLRVRWFTTEGKLQETVFSTKDLVLVNE